MTREEFQEQLLSVMERKVHWAWRFFTEGDVPKALLHLHLEQEYAVYVRDFPVLLARAYVQCPIATVRQELAENIYEEETGGLVAGRPHPELFLELPRGLGMDLARFEEVELFPAAARYRGFLDETTRERGWAVAAALTTLFLEGTPFERSVLDPSAPRRPEPPLSEHPLVKHYGLPLACLALTKAHRGVEHEHRAAAWRVMLDHVAAADRAPVIEAMRQALQLWLVYRDEVAEACGVGRERLTR